MERTGAAILEEVQCDLGVRLRPERVALTLELTPNPLEVVELAVGHDAELAILADDGLIAGLEVDNAQPRMAESCTRIGRDPYVLCVRAAVPDSTLFRYLSNDSTLVFSSLFFFVGGGLCIGNDDPSRDRE